MDTSASTDTSLLADVPVMHLASVRQRRERANLLRNVGPFRRALCARRDLEIRRQLCKVDKVVRVWVAVLSIVQWVASSSTLTHPPSTPPAPTPLPPHPTLPHPPLPHTLVALLHGCVGIQSCWLTRVVL